MISIGRQYGVRSPLVAQYHPIRGKKVCYFNKITRYCIMSPSRSCRAAADRSAGKVVDAIQVDHPRLNQAAQLKQAMPVAPVASKPGGVEAQNGPDLPGAQPCHEPPEAWPCNHSAGG